MDKIGDRLGSNLSAVDVVVVHLQCFLHELAVRVGEWLKDLGVKFDAIITSPLKRAHRTASIG